MKIAEIQLNQRRSDIDGLRGVAIFLVVAFHAFGIRGGFIGVDIFFVISGFVITELISNNLHNKNFSLVDFYINRARRIFPALALVLLFTYLFGFFLLLPTDFLYLGKHIAGAVAFISNFLLWGEVNYFDSASELKPLLHLWSLGVEEQFYLVYPLVLLVSWKLGRKFLPIVLGICILSFMINLNVIKSDLSQAFYSPLTRFWELSFGGVISLCQRNCSFYNSQPTQFILKIKKILSILGLSLIIIGCFVITKKSFFPGWWALLPVSGAALIIFAGADSIINKWLSAKYMVWLGLISFPLYLWHWPILSLLEIVTGSGLTRVQKISCILMALLLAFFTYHWIELPINRHKKSSRKFAFSFSMVLIILGSLGLITYLKGGLDYRFGSRSSMIHDLGHYDDMGLNPSKFKRDPNECLLGDSQNIDDYLRFSNDRCSSLKSSGRTVLLVGDSHAAYLSVGLRDMLEKQGYSYFQYTASYCAPLSLDEVSGRCQKINNYVYQRIKQLKPNLVIIFGHYTAWEKYKKSNDNWSYGNNLKDIVADYSRLGVEKTIIIGPFPIYTHALPKLLARDLISMDYIPMRSFSHLSMDAFSWDREMSKLKMPNKVIYVSLIESLCNSEGCLTRVGEDLRNDLIVFDYGHLTDAGASYVSKNILMPLIVKDER